MLYPHVLSALASLFTNRCGRTRIPLFSNHVRVARHFVLLSLILPVLTAAALSQTIIESDSLVLVDFYHATNGDTWINNNGWLTTAPASVWYGVTVDPSTKTVSRLNLSSNNLTDSLPPSLGTLQSPKILDLFSNSLSGKIPDLSGLTSLERVNLSVNQLSGSIPGWLGTLQNLIILRLNNNHLEGEIPSELSNLGNLQELSLTLNQLRGPINLNFDNLPNLRYVQLSNNQFTGTIPSTLAHLTSVIQIALSNNQLRGSVPQLSNARFLQLDHNELFALPDLTGGQVEQLTVQNNQFVFEDLEPNRGISQFFYTPQDSVDTIVETLNDGVRLYVNIGGSATSYMWFRNNVEIPGATQEELLVDAAEGGEFRCVATNSLLPSLTLYSHPVQLAPQPTIVINSTGDAGLNPPNRTDTCTTGGTILRDGVPEPECTLRATLMFVNNRQSGSVTRIVFDVPDVTTPVIQPDMANPPLPAVLFPINLNGSSQPSVGFVVLDGAAAGRDANGLAIEAGNSLIKGLTVQNFNAHGIMLQSRGGNTITDCTIRNNGLGENPRSGVLMLHSADNTVRNSVISGNGSGLRVDGGASTGNIIEHNKIGTNSLGSLDVGNATEGIGVYSSHTIIEHNQISGNDGVGIKLSVDAASALVEFNYIGTDTIGEVAIPNEKGGIEFFGASDIEIRTNTIAGNRSDGLRGKHARCAVIVDNIIADNDGDGVRMSFGEGSRVDSNIVSGNMKNGIVIYETINNQISTNRIGTDAAGENPIGNGEYGVVVRYGNGNVIKDNLISANRGGILLKDSKDMTQNVVELNQVGGDINGENPNGDMGNSGSGIRLENANADIDHNQAFFNENGISLSGGNRFTCEITSNDILHNTIGIDAYDAGVARIRIISNIVYDNQIGIFGARYAVLRGNDIKDNTGSGTGIHLINSNAVISGNQITGDAGDAITLENSNSTDVNNNNIFGNQGFGVKNLNPSVTANATANWWGAQDGPGGAGPGSGDEVSSGVDFANWRLDPVSVVASAERDTIFLPTGETDTVMVFLQNWVDRIDVLDIFILQSQNWLQGPSAFSVPLSDSSGAVLELAFAIPPGTADGTQDLVELTATSQAENSNSASVQFSVFAQLAMLSGIIVAPDSVTVATGATVAFTATGFDQFGRIVTFTPEWSATGGTIDAAGVFIAGDQTGTFSVTATDPVTQIQDQAIAIITPATAIDNKTRRVPEAYQLYQNYPNPFNPVTSIRYDIPARTHVTITIFDILGRKVRELLSRIHQHGHYVIRWDGANGKGISVSSGLYFYRIQTSDFVQTRKMLLVR